MATTFAIATDYHVICCWNCSGHYAVTERAYSRFSDSGKNWFCPYCGESTVVVESELTRLKKKVRQLEDDYKWADYRRANAEEDAKRERASNAAYKGQLTKTRKRIAHGVCPCCTRTFVNLQRHMATKHPDYHVEEGQEA